MSKSYYYPPMAVDIQTSVPDHQVLLAFHGDSDADLFRDWLYANWSDFLEWSGIDA